MILTRPLTTVRGMKITPLLRYPHHYNLALTVTASLCITAAYCRQYTNISNGPRINTVSRETWLCLYKRREWTFNFHFH